MNRYGGSLSLLLALVTCSCRVLQPELDPHQAEALPPAYNAMTAETATTTNTWWSAFGSDELDRLMDRAFTGNLTLAQAAARLRQVHAEARQSGAARYPALSAEAGAEISQRPATGTDASGNQTVEAYSLGLAASYELDLWGRVSAMARSAALSATASHLDLESAAMTLAAQVADRWLQLIEARAQVGLVNGQIETNRKVLDLLKGRLGRSSTRLLDVYQQEQAVRAAEAGLPALEQRVALLRHELAVLVGVSAGTDLGLTQSTLPPLPAHPDTGLPADLLLQRPDVRAGMLRLRAVGWDVVAGRADRLPALRLTASAGTQADAAAALFDDWLANLAAGLTAPLLDGGRRRAAVERQRARADEQLASYRLLILNAVREVEDALQREQYLRAGLDAREKELTSARQVIEEAQRRYLSGAADYLPVLTALRGTQQSERDTLIARRELLANRVTLCRALGGSWAAQAADNAARTRVADMMESPDTTTRKATP